MSWEVKIYTNNNGRVYEERQNVWYESWAEVNPTVNNSNLQIKNKGELADVIFVEWLAYAVFVSNDTVIPGSQKLTAEEIISGEEATELNTLLWTNHTKDELMALTNIDLSDKNLSSIPTGVFKLTNLEFLFLWDNSLWDLSINSKINNLSNLKLLDLANNNFSYIDSNITDLANLETLSLTNNNISNIYSDISNLTNLKTLYLTNNNLSSISYIDDITNLENLYLSNNNISGIYALDANLINLKVLDLSNNNIKYINSKTTNLTNLKILNWIIIIY